MYLKQTLFLGILIAFFNASAEEKLQNFKEGEYTLRTGKESECSSGEFSVYKDEGLKLNMAGLHIFDLRNFKERIEDNLDKKRECYYESEDSMEVVGDSTLLTYKETYKCGSATRHVLTRKAKIVKEAINLDAVQEGSPAFSYSCSWVYGDPRKVSSVVPKKSKKSKKSK